METFPDPDRPYGFLYPCGDFVEVDFNRKEFYAQETVSRGAVKRRSRPNGSNKRRSPDEGNSRPYAKKGPA